MALNGLLNAESTNRTYLNIYVIANGLHYKSLFANEWQQAKTYKHINTVKSNKKQKKKQRASVGYMSLCYT